MSAERALAEALFAALEEVGAAPPPPSAALLGSLGAMWQRARAAWPDIPGAPAGFFRYLAERRSEGWTPEAIAELPAVDLYIAWAALAGDPLAVEAFDAGYLAPLGAALERLDIPPPVAAEVRQILRERLLVAAEGERPRLSGYRGSGDLRSWLRVVGVREALALLRRGQREVPSGDRLLEVLPAQGAGPELEYLRTLYKTEFREAFVEALGELSPRERNLLRHQFLHGLGVDQVGAIYRVHRSTAARWLARARERLVAGTRERLMSRLRIGEADADSILRLIHSHLELSVRRFLADPET